jgi:hypothetical protein
VSGSLRGPRATEQMERLDYKQQCFLCDRDTKINYGKLESKKVKKFFDLSSQVFLRIEGGLFVKISEGEALRKELLSF